MQRKTQCMTDVFQIFFVFVIFFIEFSAKQNLL